MALKRCGSSDAGLLECSVSDDAARVERNFFWVGES